MGASGSKNVLLEPTVSDVTNVEKVFDRMYSYVSISHMFLTQDEIGSFDISGVPLKMHQKMLASRAGGLGEKKIPIKSVFPLLLHERDGATCCAGAPDIKDRLLEAKAAYLDCFTARLKDPNCTSGLREVANVYIDELCAYDDAFAERSIGVGAGGCEKEKGQLDAAKAEFLFGVLFMTCSSAAHVREAERKAKLISELMIQMPFAVWREATKKYELTWELTKSSKDGGDSDSESETSLNEKCTASLFTYGGPQPGDFSVPVDGDSEVAYTLLARFIESPSVAESLKRAPALRNALFDALMLIREFNARHLVQYIDDTKADKKNLCGALASAVAQSHKEEGKAEACADIDAYTAAKKTEMIATCVDKKTELHRKSEKALASVLEVLETKCGHDGIVRNADIKRWTESKPAPAPVKL